MRSLIIAGCISSLALFGVGCSLSPTTDQPPVLTQPIDKIFDQRPIPQFQGFGTIPVPPAPPIRPNANGTVHLNASLPTIPTNVTVLRVKDGRPDDLQIRNITSNLHLPPGVLGYHPRGQQLSLSWQDDQEGVWTLNATDRRLDMRRTTSTQSTLTVSAWPDSQVLLNTARAFLQNHGISSQYYGSFYLQPDWSAWWQAEQTNGRCMTADTLRTVRILSQEPGDVPTAFPLLAEQKKAACIHPEFPAQAIVRINVTQDGQIILHADGSPYNAAELHIDVTTMSVVSGWLTIPTDPDRSDYPAQSLRDIQAALLRGGQGGTPNGDVTIDTTSFEWYKIRDISVVPPIDYLYPALIGHGEITYADNRTAPYRIVVPLIKNELPK